MPEQENIQDAGDSQEAGSSNKDKKHDSGAADLEKVVFNLYKSVECEKSTRFWKLKWYTYYI